MFQTARPKQFTVCCVYACTPWNKSNFSHWLNPDKPSGIFHLEKRESGMQRNTTQRWLDTTGYNRNTWQKCDHQTQKSVDDSSCFSESRAVWEVTETAFTARLHAPGIFPRCLCAHHSSICFDAVKEIQLNELWPSDCTSSLLLIYSTEASSVQKAGQIILIVLPCCSGNVSILRFQASVFP